jgi:hypothetical protein
MTVLATLRFLTFTRVSSSRARLAKVSVAAAGYQLGDTETAVEYIEQAKMTVLSE